MATDHVTAAQHIYWAEEQLQEIRRSLNIYPSPGDAFLRALELRTHVADAHIKIAKLVRGDTPSGDSQPCQ